VVNGHKSATHTYSPDGSTVKTCVGGGMYCPSMVLCLVAVRRSGNVVGRINEVTLRRVRLVLGRVTVFVGKTTSVFHQATQANSASYPHRDGK